MNELPIIKLEVENMKYAILHHFETHSKQVQDAIDSEIDRVLANLDFGEIVSKAVSDATK